jgi:phosphonate utilization associated putative membrane protein
MTLSWPVAGAVLVGALLHASWNALVKSSEDKALDTALIHVIGSPLAVVLLFVVGLPLPASWPFLATSLTVHIAYYVALSSAYKHGDLGLTYPLMRGTAPLLVALSATFTVGESLSPVAWAGVLAVSGGVLALGFAPRAHASRRAVAFALANAVVIAIYTVVDALGARASGNTLAYVVLLFAVDGWPFAFIVLARRGTAGAGAYAKRRWPLALAGAAASVGSYGIALWAMTRAPVAVVAALRETSVLFAAVLGVMFLKEAFNLRRAAGTGAIVAGVLALRLG